MTRKTPILLIAAALISATLPAQEVRMKDGRVLVGPTRKLNRHLEVQTLQGKVRVKLDEVARVREVADLKKDLRLISASSGSAATAFGQLEIARVAKRYGLYDDMWRHLGIALHMGKRNAGVQRRARDFMGELEPVVLPKRWRKQKAKVWVKEVLFRLNAKKLTQAKKSTIEELLVRSQRPEIEPALKLRARRATSPLQRSVAIMALKRRSGEKSPYSANDRFVYRTAILDSRVAVRQAAMDATQSAGHSTAAVTYLSPGLVHRDPRVRIRTAEAFGRLKDVQAVPAIVDAGPTAAKVRAGDLGGGSTRAHMAVLEQRSYVRDFDVEVAQAANIANPVVDVLQTGVVLDVTVAAVTTIRTDISGAYRRALRDITGEDPGSDPRGWKSWYEAWRDKRNAAKKPSPTKAAPKTGTSKKN